MRGERKTCLAIPTFFERFGCTVCHGGQGRATTVEAAHQGVRKHEAFVLPGGRIAYVSEREEPLRPSPLVQAACGSCHMGPDVPGAPLLLAGKRLSPSAVVWVVTRSRASVGRSART